MNPTSRPTVVIVDSSVAVTGAFRCAQRMARLLAEDVRTVLVLPREANIAKQDLACFARVERLPLVPPRKSPGSLLRYGPALVASGMKLRSLLRREEATTLVVNDFFQLQGWMVRRLGWRGRIVTWVRFDPQRFPRPLARLLLHAAGSVSGSSVAVSRFIQQRLPAGLRAQLLYDCVDPGLQAASDRKDDGKTLVCVGNYIPGKGQDHVVAAFAKMAAAFPAAQLRFFGGDMGLQKNRAFRAELERRVEEWGLSDRVIFSDFTDDLPAAMDGAAVALNLSEAESFSLSCLEAQQLGVPVIAFRSGGPEEIIVDGETGLLLPIGDIGGVAAAVGRLLGDPELRRTMGQAAAAHVQQTFGADAFAATLRPLLLSPPRR